MSDEKRCFLSQTLYSLCGFCTFLKTEMSTRSARSFGVTVLPNRPVLPVTNVSVSGVTVNLYRFIDSSSFCLRLVHRCSRPSFMSTVSHKYFLESAASLCFLHCLSPLPFVWPASSFEWICFVPLVSAQANLPHRHSFGLLFHPPTLRKTVCSKDCNLTANLYGFLQGRALSLAEWFARDVETLWSLRSSLPAEFEGRSFHTYSDAPAVTTGVVKCRAKRCVRLYLFNDDAHYL